MVVGVPAGPGPLALGVVLLVVSSIVAIFTEQFLALVYRRQGEGAYTDPPDWVLLFVRVLAIGVAALGALLVTSSI